MIQRYIKKKKTRKNDKRFRKNIEKKKIIKSDFKLPSKDFKLVKCSLSPICTTDNFFDNSSNTHIPNCISNEF